MNKEFKKSDLKDGMIVELFNSTRGIILENRIVFEDGYIYLDSLDENMKNRYYIQFSVAKVYKSDHLCGISGLFDDEYLELIYERYDIDIPADDAIKLLKILTGKNYKIIS